ncbi:MAG: hypothetical protein CVU92_03505 [Firmicutes bacterium HGW-Firmicutes-17]|jgi:hypothetical protein|nr:MAG: hypothetical protein CVU92_03505 [Firmicutes bacterium HGW-Firmicutes-17]
MKYVQILNNRAHWIFEAQVKPDFAKDIILVDITGKDQIKEGWFYDSITGLFSESADPKPSIDEIIRANYLETQYQTVLMEMQSGI